MSKYIFLCLFPLFLSCTHSSNRRLPASDEFMSFDMEVPPHILSNLKSYNLASHYLRCSTDAVIKKNMDKRLISKNEKKNLPIDSNTTDGHLFSSEVCKKLFYNSDTTINLVSFENMLKKYQEEFWRKFDIPTCYRELRNKRKEELPSIIANIANALDTKISDFKDMPASSKLYFGLSCVTKEYQLANRNMDNQESLGFYLEFLFARKTSLALGYNLKNQEFRIRNPLLLARVWKGFFMAPIRGLQQYEQFPDRWSVFVLRNKKTLKERKISFWLDKPQGVKDYLTYRDTKNISGGQIFLLPTDLNY